MPISKPALYRAAIADDSGPCAFVRIGVLDRESGNLFQLQGSGTLVEGGRIVTAAHVLRPGLGGAFQWASTILNSPDFQGKHAISLNAIDHTAHPHKDYGGANYGYVHDIGYFDIDPRIGDYVTSAPLAKRLPRMGEKLIVMGWGATNIDPSTGAASSWDSHLRRAVLEVTKLDQDYAFHMWAANGAQIVDRDSGGSVFTMDGQLVGIISRRSDVIQNDGVFLETSTALPIAPYRGWLTWGAVSHVALFDTSSLK